MGRLSFLILVLGSAILFGGCDSTTIYSPSRDADRSTRGERSGDQEEDLTSVYEDDLLAWLPFDGSPEDAAGGQHFAILEGPHYVPDRHGNSAGALWFDGVDDFATISQGRALQIPLPISVSYWVSLDQTRQTAGLITTSFQDSHNTGVFLTFDSHTGAPAVSVGDGGLMGSGSRKTLHSNIPLEAREWHHVVAVVDSVESVIVMTIYVNGLPAPRPSYSGGAEALDYGFGPVVLGKRVASEGQHPLFFAGALDDLAFFDRVLTPDDVKHLFEAPGFQR